MDCTPPMYNFDTMNAEMVGTGRQAEMKRLPDGRVLKHYFSGYSREGAQKEARLTHLAWEAGAPAPRVDAVIEKDGRLGLVMEFIPGESLRRLITRHPLSLSRHAHLLAETQARIHALPGTGFPDLREVLRASLPQLPHLSPERRLALGRFLETVKPTPALCHGDFHPDNLLVAGDSVRVIDWPNACRGDPAADIARTLLLLRHAALPAAGFTRQLMSLFRQRFAGLYLKAMRSLSPLAVERVPSWLPLLAAARISEMNGQENAALLAYLR